MGISQLGKGSQRGAHLWKELPHSSDTFSDCLLRETGSQAMIPPGPHLDKAAWLCMPLAFSLTLNLTEDPEHRHEGSLNLPLPILATLYSFFLCLPFLLLAYLVYVGQVAEFRL